MFFSSVKRPTFCDHGLISTVIHMFPFSLCLGIRQKSSSQQPDHLDQKASTSDSPEAPLSSSRASGSTKATFQNETKILQKFERSIVTPVRTSIGMKSSSSSVISRPGARRSIEPSQIQVDSRLSHDFGWLTPQIKSKMLSGALNLNVESAELNPDLSLTIQEESEEPFSARPHSYSDDPFAPPTPRLAKFASSQYSHSRAESETVRGSVVTTRAPSIDANETCNQSTDFTTLNEPKLPSIARISKLSFDWILDLPNSPLTPHSRSRLPSMTRSSTLSSPVTIPRVPRGSNATKPPRTPRSPLSYSSKSAGTNQVPFPEYP